MSSRATFTFTFAFAPTFLAQRGSLVHDGAARRLAASVFAEQDRALMIAAALVLG